MRLGFEHAFFEVQVLSEGTVLLTLERFQLLLSEGQFMHQSFEAVRVCVSTVLAVSSVSPFLR